MRNKIPHISVTVGADREDKSTSGSISILSLGYGIHQAWIYLAMFSPGSIFDSSALVTLELGFAAIEYSLATLVFIISIIVFGLCLLIESFTDQKFLKLYVSRRVLISAGVLTALGTFAVFGTSTADAAGWFFCIFAGVATGIGSSLLLIFWGTAYARYGTAAITINAALAISIAIAIFTVIFHWVPRPFSGVLTAFLPLIELPILYQLTPIPYSQRHEVPIFNALAIKRAPFVFRFGIPVVFFGLALGALRAVSIQIVLPSSDTVNLLVMWLAAGCATILTISAVLLSVSSAKKNMGLWDMFFRALVPIIAFAVLAMYFLEDNPPIFSLILLIGYMCFEALMWIFFGELSQRFRLSPILVFGLGRGLLALASLVGSSTVVLASTTPSLSEGFKYAEWPLFILVAIVVAYALLPREQEIQAIVSPIPAAPDNAVAQLNAIVNDDSPDTVKLPQSESVNRVGRFRAQCEAISNEFLLSRREAEVLFLLAKGYNAAFIQEKLYISRSTAKTHIGHIYRKLNIHTQQELLSMFDGIKQDEKTALECDELENQQ